MTSGSLRSVSYVVLVLLVTICATTVAGENGFSARSLKGTYYIPCACEGPARVAGMGKVYFDGKSEITLTQYQVYMEQDGNILQPVKDGLVRLDDTGLPDPPYEATRTGTYTVNSEGFGDILWDGSDPDDPADPSTPKPTLMIKEAKGRNAVSVYLILPDGVKDHLIHVVAAKRQMRMDD